MKLSEVDCAALACLEYDWWASEVQRTTDAISMNECPNEGHWMIETDPEPLPSCFTTAKTTPIIENHLGEERRASLDDIAESVNDCPACTQLVKDIRARRHARKRLGVAKRKIRHVAKRIRAAS